MNNSSNMILSEFYIWEGVFESFYFAKQLAEGFGFSGETYNSK